MLFYTLLLLSQKWLHPNNNNALIQVTLYYYPKTINIVVHRWDLNNGHVCFSVHGHVLIIQIFHLLYFWPVIGYCALQTLICSLYCNWIPGLLDSHEVWTSKYLNTGFPKYQNNENTRLLFFHYWNVFLCALLNFFLLMGCINEHLSADILKPAPRARTYVLILFQWSIRRVPHAPW